MKPLAIVIPAYNAQHTILDTLHSLAKQDHLEQYVQRICVIDDCSSDDTFAITKNAAKLFGQSIHFEVSRNSENMGERRTINAAFERLQQEFDWIAVLHADDIALPQWLSELSSQTHQYPDAVSICSSWNNVSETGKVTPGEHRIGASPVVIEAGIESARGTFDKGCWWHFSGCLMNLKAFHEVGAFLPDMPQLGDLEWLIRALLRGKHLIYVPLCLIDYRAYATSVTSVSFKSGRDAREMLRITRIYRVEIEVAQQLKQVTLWKRRMLRRAIKLGLRGQFNDARNCLRLRREWHTLGLELK